MSELLGADGAPIGPKMDPETTEWAIGDQALPPTPGTVEDWREFSIVQPQLPMMVYIWISTSRALRKQNDRVKELEGCVGRLTEALHKLAMTPGAPYIGDLLPAR